MYGHCAGDIADDTDSTEPEVIDHSPESSADTKARIPGAGVKGSSDVTNSTVKKTSVGTYPGPTARQDDLDSSKSSTSNSVDINSPELVVTATSPGDANSTVKSANITNSTSQGAVPTRTKGINSTNQGAVANLLTGIKAPTVVKRRGRPRGHELTTIGLPAKKAKKAESLK